MLLRARSALLALEASFPRGPGGLGSPPRLLRQGGFLHQPDQALDRVLAVSLLAAKSTSLDDEHSFTIQLLAGVEDQPIANLFGEGSCVLHVEAQLNRGGHFVHILATWAGCSDETKLHLPLRDPDGTADRDHTGDDTGRGPLNEGPDGLAIGHPPV